MNTIEFFRGLGSEASSLIRSLKDPLKVVGINPLGQKSMKIDVALENLVVRRLNESKVGNLLVTEEKGEIKLSGKKGVLVLDPLDGSNNFQRKVPSYGFIIAFAEGRHYQDITHSYIKDLSNGDEYWAIKGKGAFMNGRSIRTSKETELENSILEYDPNSNQQIYKRILPLLENVKDIRRFGANALALCYIANGAHQIFVDLENRLSIIHAAGLKIAEEAGAVVTDHKGRKINPPLKEGSYLSFVCSANKTLHKKVLKLVK